MYAQYILCAMHLCNSHHCMYLLHHKYMHAYKLYIFTSNLIPQASSHGKSTSTASTVNMDMDEQEDGPSSSTNTLQDAGLNCILPKYNN